MAKVLLSKLPQAVSEVIGNIYQGVIAARDTGIDWARSPDKIDFQVEVILAANDIAREQVETASAMERVTEESEQVTTQLQGEGITTSEEESHDETSSSGSESSSRSGSQSSSRSGSQSGSRSSSSSGSQSQSQSESQSTSQSDSTSRSFNWLWKTT